MIIASCCVQRKDDKYASDRSRLCNHLEGHENGECKHINLKRYDFVRQEAGPTQNVTERNGNNDEKENY